MNSQNLLHFLLTSIDGEANNMMYAMSSYTCGGSYTDFLVVW